MNLRHYTNIQRSRVLLTVILLLVSTFVTSAEKQGANRVETLSEVSIIGSNELPNVNFGLNWKLPTIDKREEASPPENIPGVLQPIEPVRHRQQLHFSRFLEVDSPSFKPR